MLQLKNLKRLLMNNNYLKNLNNIGQFKNLIDLELVNNYLTEMDSFTSL